MTDNNHPITPPEELVLQWMHEASSQPPGPDARVIATLAARWGSDQELEACCEWTAIVGGAEALRAARRPPVIPETIEVDGHIYQLVK